MINLIQIFIKQLVQLKTPPKKMTLFRGGAARLFAKGRVIKPALVIVIKN